MILGKFVIGLAIFIVIMWVLGGLLRGRTRRGRTRRRR